MGTALQYKAQFAVAKNEIGEVISSSPFVRSDDKHERCSAAVPLDTETAYFETTYSERFFSISLIFGPVVKKSIFWTFTT